MLNILGIESSATSISRFSCDLAFGKVKSVFAIIIIKLKIMSNNQQQQQSGAAASNAGQHPEQQPQSGSGGGGKMMNQVEYAKYKQEDTDSSNFYAHSSEATVRVYKMAIVLWKRFN